MEILKRALSLPVDSSEHRDIRDGLIICGRFMVARYYLSMLTGKAFDYETVTEADYLNALRQFLVKNISPDSVEFCFEAEGEGHVSNVVLPVLMDLFCRRTGIEPLYKLTKQDRALVTLFNNPDWSDLQIRETMKTTDKQMVRWSDFKLARRIQSRYREATENS
ncbi:MAG: hypothetical protein JXM70_29825 [Pirellulales bacterium]|nr:hypothetical protein [Pirellulales bacterium]